ncbi:MAG: hypothetical protein COA78_11445 [Blastopirellula sp.]|nr:MAG: hypothetical protein COA78_11445 [Blastopirellula sp.]
MPNQAAQQSPSSEPAVNNRGFVFLNITQFFGAANDNILKQLLMFGLASGGIWAGQMGKGGQAIASLCLAIPFVLFSGFAGQFSDRFSKRDVSIAVKLSEVMIAVIALFGLWIENVWVVLAAMVLISLQSTFFTPAKFGIIPEILPANKLSRANGTLNMFTYIAVILGGAVGGPLYAAYAPDLDKFPDAVRMVWLPGVILLVVGILGTAASFGLPKLSSKNPDLKIRPILFRPYFETWREISGTPVASVIVAWSYFYFILGGLAIMILPDYKELLDISYFQASILLAILGIAIGIGDYIAGRISHHQIRHDLIPIGIIGTTASFFVLGVIPPNYWLVAVCLSCCGFMAGFFMVPLQTMIQHFTSEKKRGQVLGLWSCCSFLGIIIGNVLFIAIKQTGIDSNRVFLVCGVLGLIGVAAYFLHWKKIFSDAIDGEKVGELADEPA